MRHFFRIFLPILLLTSLDAVERPNILFIYTDDQAPWALGKSGNPEVSTPNLDKLAGESLYLPNSFTVTPVCSPSRVSLLNSRYGTEVGITDWIKPRERFFKENPEDQPGIDPDAPNFAKDLRKAGYRTALIGKYHLGERPECHPLEIGFDHFMGFLEGGTSPENPTLEIEGEQKPRRGLTVDLLTDNAIAYLDARKGETSPFLLCVHYRAPHTRWLPVAPEDWAPFEKLDPTIAHPNYPGLDLERAKKMMREYLASVRGVDRNVGRLLSKLDEIEAREKTVVIFTSDHGYNMGHNGIWHKGNGHWLLKKELMPPGTENVPAGQRPNLYDNSVKVPTLVRWPGVIEPGTETENSITNLDWYPTFMEMAAYPWEPVAPVRGRSLVPLFNGEAETWEDEVFLQYSTEHQSRTHMRGWRSANHKLIRDFLNPGRDEFYDLSEDPGETNNLINRLSPENQEIVDEFTRKIEEKMKEIEDPALDR